MNENSINNYIGDITKASTYFVFNNGPIKQLHEEGKVSKEDIDEIQKYIQNHLSYLYKVLLEENNLEKFNLIMKTMNNFYVNDEIKIEINDEGFNQIYKNLFSLKSDNIKLK